MANPIRKLVQLVLDKRAATKMEGDAKKSLGGVNKALGGLKKAALSLAGVMASAFAVRAVIRFGKETVRVAAEADAIWTRLGQAVENVGENFATARPEVEAMARAMQDVTTVGDEDFAEILTELITTSGDYAKSLENVGVVADLSAAKQIEMKTAAQLVGRAMVGQTSTLTRYGIVIEEGQDAMEVLRKTFRGFAESEAESVEGKLKRLNNEWSDFKQAVGEAVIAGSEGESMLDRLTLSVQSLTEWLGVLSRAWAGISETFTRNRSAIQRVLSGAETRDQALTGLRVFRELTERELAAAEQALEDFGGTWRKIGGAFLGEDWAKRSAEIESVRETVDGLRLTMSELDRTMAGLEAGTIDVGGAPVVTAPTPPEAEGAQEGLTAAQKEGLQIALRLRTAQETYNDTVARLRELLEAGAITQQTFARAMLEAGAAINNARTEAAEFGKDLDGAADGADALADGLDGVGEAAQRSYAEVIALNAAADLGAGLVAALFGSDLGKLAAQKAEQNAIMAAEQLAMAAAVAFIPGFQGEAAGHLQAAGMFATVAAAWGALAGATGGFSGGGGGGGSGSPRDTGGAASERAEAPGDEVHIYFVGPGFSAVNPEVQKVVYGAAQEAAANFGPNTKIKYHRRPRG